MTIKQARFWFGTSVIGILLALQIFSQHKPAFLLACLPGVAVGMLLEIWLKKSSTMTESNRRLIAVTAGFAAVVICFFVLRLVLPPPS